MKKNILCSRKTKKEVVKRILIGITYLSILAYAIFSTFGLELYAIVAMGSISYNLIGFLVVD